MNQRCPKFIVTRSTVYPYKMSLMFGWCFYHRDMLSYNGQQQCMGGGWYRVDEDNKVIELYGSSDDFGTPYYNDVVLGLKNSKRDLEFYLPYILENMLEHEVADGEYKVVCGNEVIGTLNL